jgi:hypothetical protein
MFPSSNSARVTAGDGTPLFFLRRARVENYMELPSPPVTFAFWVESAKRILAKKQPFGTSAIVIGLAGINRLRARMPSESRVDRVAYSRLIANRTGKPREVVSSRIVSEPRNTPPVALLQPFVQLTVKLKLRKVPDRRHFSYLIAFIYRFIGPVISQFADQTIPGVLGNPICPATGVLSAPS